MLFNVRTLARAADDIDFSAATSAVCTGPAVWAGDGTLDIPFDRELTEVEVAAVLRQLTSVDDTEANLWAEVADLVSLEAVLTAAQTRTLVRALARLAIINHRNREA